MSLLQGASGVNDNTLIYIVNALDGSVKKVSTLAENAGGIAREAADEAVQIVNALGEMRTDFQGQIDAQSDRLSVTMTEEQVQELVDIATGEITDELTGYATQSSVTQTANNITATFTQQVNNIQNAIYGIEVDTDSIHSTWIQATADGILIGTSDSPVKLRITNSAVEILEDGHAITYWNNQAQLTPKSLTIPEGGNFTIGHFRWVPRSSGNLSLVKVN